jgi:hypothetical protein
LASGGFNVSDREWRKTSAVMRRLPDMLHELRDLRRRIDELERGR